MEKIMDEKEFESEKLKHVITDGMEYIQFKKLLEYPELKHGYILKSNNMNFRLGKDFWNIKNVKENLKKVSEEIGFNYENIIRPDYDHTSNVMTITMSDKLEKPSLSGKNLKTTDGLVTDLNEIPIMSTNADCNLILIYDPIKKVIGNIHAGWRGTFGKIAKNALQKMKEQFACDSKDIICCMCPSIRKCHFEVDIDVARECKRIFGYTRKIR